VLQSWSFSHPTGGKKVIFHLAKKFNEMGYKTLIMYLKDDDKFMYAKTGDSIFRQSRIHSLKRRLVAARALKPALSIYFRKIRGVDYDFSTLANVPILGVSDPKSTPYSKRIIATLWSTAFFVKDYLRYHNSEGFYLIQHAEDDPSIFGPISKYAALTYDFPLRKIVINDPLRVRFAKDDPILFHVGIDTKFYRIISPIETRSPKAILFPLRKLEYKGTTYALEAAELLRKQDSSVTIQAFGDLETHDVPPYIEYHKLPRGKKLLELYNNSSIFILPSIVEGFALPPLEAMSCGNAVIVTDCVGVKQYIKNNENGILIPARDAQAIANAARALMRDSELRTRLAYAGWRTSQSFDIESQSEQSVELLRRVLREDSKN
jgi:glycosyltransferase involved in cell wall biosynthesis